MLSAFVCARVCGEHGHEEEEEEEEKPLRVRFRVAIVTVYTFFLAPHLRAARIRIDVDTHYIGIQTSQDARFYAASRKFDGFSNEDKPLVVQFSVKHEQNIDCGGGYVKLFDCSLDQTDMHGESPYEIMFGPDICGPGTKKVHVIFSYKGKNHLISKDIRCKDDVYTHFYTLIVRPDNTYEVLIDNEKVESGNLEDDWDFLAPKKIKDPTATKPEDWDDRVSCKSPPKSDFSPSKNRFGSLLLNNNVNLCRPPFPIPMTRSPRTGTNQSTFPTQMPQSLRIGTMRWTASGSHR